MTEKFDSEAVEIGKKVSVLLKSNSGKLFISIIQLLVNLSFLVFISVCCILNIKNIDIDQYKASVIVVLILSWTCLTIISMLSLSRIIEKNDE
jgi:hypothetical protein